MTFGPAWNDEQIALFDAAGVPDHCRMAWAIFGTTEDHVALAIWHSLRGAYWPELTITPKETQMYLWRHPGVPSAAEMLAGRPGVLPWQPPAARPEGDPCHVVKVNAREPYAGVRLGVALWQWGLSVDAWPTEFRAIK